MVGEVSMLFYCKDHCTQCPFEWGLCSKIIISMYLSVALIPLSSINKERGTIFYGLIDSESIICHLTYNLFRKYSPIFHPSALCIY